MDFLFTEQQPDLDHYSALEKVRTSPAPLGVRAFQSCNGGCKLVLVFRVTSDLTLPLLS